MSSENFQVFTIMNVETVAQYQVEMENVDVMITNDRIRMQSTSIIKCYYNNSRLHFKFSGVIALAAIQIQSTQIILHKYYGPGLYFNCPFAIRNRSSLLTMDIQDSVIEGWTPGIHIKCSALTVSRLSIQRTNITDNYVGVMIENSTVNSLIVEDTRFVDNKSFGLYHECCSLTMNFMIQNAYFENNGFYTLSIFGGLNVCLNSVNNFTIKDSNFKDNHAIGVLLKVTNEYGNAIDGNGINAVIKNTTVKGNKFGIIIQNFVLANILIQDTSIIENDNGITIVQNEHANVSSRNTISCLNCTIVSSSEAAITLINLQNKVIVSNSNFQDNKGTPIIAYRSKLELSGETNFESNTAIRGGGLSLIYSNVYFANNSKVTFRNNSAKEVGGAIYIVSRYAAQTSFRDLAIISAELSLNLVEDIPCFYQFNATTQKEFETLRIQVNFINNTAMLGGDAIYGAPLNNTCTNLDGLLMIGETSKIFNFKEAVNQFSPIASDPTRVCFCDGNGSPQCKSTNVVHNEVRYPGEIFDVSLVLVGYNFGTVTGSLYATILSTGSHKQLGENQHTQAANFSSCNNLVYSVHS